MLKIAYGNVSQNKLNALITNGDYKYLSYGIWTEYEPIELKDSDWEELQQVSIDNHGNVIGYFQARIDRGSMKIDSLYIVRFDYMFDEYTKDKFDKLKEMHILDKNTIFRNDMKRFIHNIMNSNQLTGVEFSAIAENKANKTYKKWMEEYNGERFLFKNYTHLRDGKMYDAYKYWFDRTKA